MGSSRNSTSRIILGILGVGNLLGALVSFFYFRFVDSTAAELPDVGLLEIVYSIVAFGVLVFIGYRVGRRWADPLISWRGPEGLPDATIAMTRRRALLLPYALAGISVVGWLLAGVIWGVVLPYLAGILVPHRIARVIFGTTVIAGGVTCTFIFFMVSLVPLSVLAVLSYTRALALVGADPAAAAEAVGGLRLIMIFILAAGMVAAVGLSIFAANSVAGPLKDVEAAMAEVEQGRLGGRAPVVSTDEIGAVAEGFNRMLHGLREREMVKETFGKYVTPEIRDEILAGRFSGDGELNEYFTEMAEAIRAQRGLVLQFIGDEIEAVFGAPIASRDHAAMAVRAALDMRGRLRAWNARREAAGKPALRHGIGIHTGTVLAGNIGGAERLSYALVGDPVNLASR